MHLSESQLNAVYKILSKPSRTKKPPNPFSFNAQCWKKWRQKFSRYAKALQEHDPDIKEKHLIYLLKYFMGEPMKVNETFRIIEHQGWNSRLTLKETLDRLSDHFRRVERGNLYSRVNFHRRVQLQGESVHSFIMAIEYLAELCQFTMSYNVTMRDKVVTGINDDVARELMFQYDDLLTYNAAKKIVYNHELRHVRMRGN